MVKRARPGSPGIPGPKGEPGPIGPAGAVGAAGVSAPKATFVLRVTRGDPSKSVTARCEAGEQAIAATCATGASLAQDGTASCPAPANGDLVAQLTLTCAK